MTQKQTEILWREEKYRVMFHSQKHYNLMRQAMREQLPYAKIEQLLTEALSCTPSDGSMQNACQHMWGYFKKFATTDEKERYNELINERNFQQLLLFLQELAQKYQVTYLLDSTLLH